MTEAGRRARKLWNAYSRTYIQYSLSYVTAFTVLQMLRVTAPSVAFLTQPLAVARRLHNVDFSPSQ